MEKENIVKLLSERFDKKEEIIRYMMKVLEKENYNLNEINELIIEFFSNNYISNF